MVLASRPIAKDRHPIGFAQRAHGITGSAIDNTISLLEATTRPTISFAMGAPAPNAMPGAILRSLADRSLAANPSRALTYAPTPGDSKLRGAMLDDALLTQGAAADELLITSGGMQGLDLVCKLFLDPGDLVICESPTYTNAIGTITSYGGRILEIPIDDNGLMVERIRPAVRKAGARPRMIYVIPNFQNPSGTTLSAERRAELLALADDYDALILEDDPYGLLWFDRPGPASLWSQAGGRGRVVAVNTFSKIMAPGLRVGWVLAPPPVIRRMIDAKQGMDTCTNGLAQTVIDAFLRDALLVRHVQELRNLYRGRKQRMIAALTREFSGLNARWSDPAGGFFLWFTLPDQMSATRLFPVALEEGVAFVPGTAFSAGGHYAGAMRLCFSACTDAEIDQGVVRLRRAVDRLSQES